LSFIAQNQIAMRVKDFNKWDLQPRLLNEEEIADPMKVVNEVFDYAHLPDLRNTLWEWLKTTISGNFNKSSLHFRDRESLIAFFEKMEKLLEAAHLLLVTKKLARPGIKNSTSVASTVNHPVQDVAPAAELVPIVERLVALLSPEWVFEMGMIQELNSQLPIYYFLVVIPNTSTRTYGDCQALVETVCSENGTVQLVTIKRNEFHKALEEGHLLYSPLCRDEYLVYAKDNQPLPQVNTQHLPEMATAARTFLDTVLAKAQAFYNGAIFYLTQSDYSLAAFMLQQAAEHALRGFLHAVTDRNNVSHELLTLRRYALPFFRELVHILPVEADREVCLLYRFGKAYVQARYQNDFTMGITEMSQMKEWVEKLLPETKRVFEQRINEILVH
jgi:HEPN domain-containing protein